MEETNFDVFVIGSGVAGQTVAKACVKAGLKVAIADKREFGGTCSNRGCDPKKVLLGATEVLEAAENLKGKGIEKLPELNWKKLQKFKKKFTHKIPRLTEEKLEKLGIQMYHQSPRFLDANSLTVEGKTVTADKVVIATGYEPKLLPFEGNKLLKTSDDFLKLKKIPKHITFIGAGYVGMEFAHMASRAGAKVTIIDSGERPLAAFDEELVQLLTQYSEQIGIEFIFGAHITSVNKARKNFKIGYTKGKKKKHLKSKMVFNTAGRVPAISQLDLEKGNVSFSENGIGTNEFLQSKTNKGVYACGDVADSGLPISPLAGREGYVVAQNIINGNKKKQDLPHLPSVVFTSPQMASVGYSEEEAKRRYKNIVVNYKSIPNAFNAKRINAPVYAYKIVLNERNEEIVGAHLLGPEAAETINMLTMAMNTKMTAKQVKRMIFTYPSWANDIKSML